MGIGAGDTGMCVQHMLTKPLDSIYQLSLSTLLTLLMIIKSGTVNNGGILTVPISYP